jgi:glycosyltransferase involved in cell wall biosynthesis
MKTSPGASVQSAVAPKPAGVPATRVKVLRIIARLNIGGPARHAAILSEGLQDRGFDTLLTYGSVAGTEGSLEDLVAARGLRATKIPELGRRIQFWSDFRALYQLTRLMFREQPDVVHTHTAKAGTLGRLAAAAFNATRRRDRRCIVIHTFHGHVFRDYFGPLASVAVRWVERAMALVTDRIITISTSQKSDICERYRIVPEWKTDVIELGIELTPLLGLESELRLRHALGFAANEVVFGYVGRFVPIKDLPTLIHAFARVTEVVPNVRLTLVGDGEERSRLEALAAELKLGDRVKFIGWRQNLKEVYGALDVGVLSSLNEGTPVALIEAMAAAKPVIATAVGGVEDVVSHGRTGLLVPPRDVERLATAIVRMATDSAVRQSLGRLGRREVTARFSPARLISEVGQLYLRTLTEQRRLASSHEWARCAVARPLHVLGIIARLNVGGPARHAALLADRLRAHGFDSLLVHGSLAPDEGSLEDLVSARRLRALKYAHLGRRIRPWSDLLAFYSLVRLMFRERPDVVHTHTAKAGTLGRLAALVYNATRARRRRCVVVHTFHGHVFSGYFGRAAGLAVQAVERMLARISDRIVTISKSQNLEICGFYRIAPASKTAVIELGIELEPLLAIERPTSLRGELGFGPDCVVFGYVGRFAPIKDLPTLVRAFALAARRVPAARLILVGDGELRATLERLVDALGLTDRVRFTGWRRDLAGVYSAIDVGVLSSKNEGTPVALIEAMAAGKPVVATAVGGIEDVVRDGVTGQVVPAGDVDALAGAMVRLALDPMERRRLGLNGRREMTARFGADRVVDDMSCFYRQALAAKRRVPVVLPLPDPRDDSAVAVQ